MAKAKLRKEKQVDVASGSPSEKEYPRANFPANKDLIHTFSVGDDVVVTVKGKICALNSHESNDYSNADFSVEVTDIEMSAESENEYEKMAKDEETDT